MLTGHVAELPSGDLGSWQDILYGGHAACEALRTPPPPGVTSAEAILTEGDGDSEALHISAPPGLRLTYLVQPHAGRDMLVDDTR